MPDPTASCLCNHPAARHDEPDGHCQDCPCTGFEEDPIYEPTPLLTEQIAGLQEDRERVAALTQTLAERELTGRILRLTIETERRAAGDTQTAAEKAAKVDPRYLDHERRSIQLSFDQAVALAHAEAQRFEIELQLAVLRRTAGAA